MRRVPWAIVFLLPSLASAARHPEAQVALEVLVPPRPGLVPEAAPSRFVLLDDGQVYVGGTSALAEGRLAKAELKELDRRIAAVRKLAGLGSAVTFAPGETEYRLWLKRGGGLEIVARGDPGGAPASLRPLAQLVEQLAGMNPATLKPLVPRQYLLRAVEQALDGGCRPWTLPTPLPDVLDAPRLVGAEGVATWPTGAVAASVCAGGKRYAATLRPLVPGEKP